ncbi:topless-related protein 4-like [Ananas comosus]|uniref:Topless-related protein 4-like n=1 Tax=Ananas comosus TaxID=4615 RepID=A0A6P5G1H4_ANACO|nr:topless-related protein 4-like [Ananas comosus]
MSNSDAKNIRIMLLLERETQIFFDLPYFEGLVLAGAWNDADWYLKGFTKLDENWWSQKIFFELYKTMFFEALVRSDTAKAVEILRKYLRLFEPIDKEIFTELCRLLSLEHEELKNLGDTNSMRQGLCRELTELIKANPVLKDKLEMPKMGPSSPRTMIDQNFPSPEPLAQMEPHAIGLNATYSPTEVSSTLPTQRSQRPRHSLDVLPRTVIMTLIQGSLVSTMDFNPAHPTVLLVGTSTGEISVWDLTVRERIHHRNYVIGNASEAFQMAPASDPTIAANRVRWDPNGIIFGVAFSKNIVHLYNYNDHHELTNKSEIEAHVGGVNDIAFSRPHGLLYVITCGDDKIIKVWDAESKSLVRTFEGHSAPVCSVLPHSREDFHFIFSSSMDGRMKAWSYNNVHNSAIDCPMQGNSFCNMAYNADETRLFACGIREDGLAYLEQWDDQNGNKVCSYVGFNNQCNGVPQFDVANIGILAAGEEYKIKFWDTDYVNLWTTIDAEGGLPALPCIRFNKSGSLLAVSTNDSRFKILANDDAQQLLNIGNQPNVVPGPSSEPKSKNGESPISRYAHNSVPEELNDGSRKRRKPMEVQKRCQYYSLRLPDRAAKVERMVYTFSGNGILSLNSDGIHKLWKWQKTEANKSGQATATFPPLLWTPSSGMMMNNELGNANVGAAHCFALSKNDGYLVSSSGGNTSIVNMINFKRVEKIKHSLPAVTFLACYLQDNNILAIGMQDSTIQIVNIRFDEVRVWGIDGWKKQCSRSLKIPSGQLSSPGVEIKIQFCHNQVHLLAVAKTQLAIYDVATLELLKQWQPENGQITDGTYSCDRQMIYASLMDGVYTFTSDLDVRRRIRPQVYQNPQIPKVYTLVIAAHPSKPTQFALGLSDGNVQVLERPESEKQRETLPPTESASLNLEMPVDSQLAAHSIHNRRLNP